MDQSNKARTELQRESACRNFCLRTLMSYKSHQYFLRSSFKACDSQIQQAFEAIERLEGAIRREIAQERVKTKERGKTKKQ